MNVQEIIDLDDMYQAYIDCKKHKSNKFGTKRFEINALYNVKCLVDEINRRTYATLPSHCFIVYYPAPREVFCAHFRDRVVQHFVYNELNPIIEKKLIYDTANCRKNKGTDFAINRVKRFMRQATDNYTTDAYYLQLDLSGFFMSIDRKVLFDKINKLIEDEYKGKYKNTLKYLVRIIILTDVTKDAIRLSKIEEWDKLPKRKTLFGNKNGLPIGNISSQLFANYYLNDFDHLMKNQFRYVSRYVDDIIIIDKDKYKLKMFLDNIDSSLCNLNLHINKNKSKINNCKYGIHFLGVNIKPYYAIVDDRRIGKLYKDRYKNADELYFSSNSRRGLFLRYSGYNIMIKWYNCLDDSTKEKLKLYKSNLLFYKY